MVRNFNKTTQLTGVTNQQGLVKQYELIHRSPHEIDNQFCRWEEVIHGLNPRHSDDTLYETLQLYHKWNGTHICRLIYCKS